MNGDHLSFDVVVGYGCNWRCRYCYERDSGVAYQETAMSEDVAARYAAYLKHMRETFPEASVSVQIFGGEPMLYFDLIKRIIADAGNAADVYNIVTNGSLTAEHQAGLLNMSQAAAGLGTALTASVSYDFTFQNDNRQAGSYDSVREAIRWLHGRDMLRKTITVFDKSTLPRMDEVFFDFIALREECPGLRCGYNLDLQGDLADFDGDAASAALGRIRDWLREHPEHRGAFFHNSGADRGRAIGEVVNCVNPDGSVTFGCSSIYRRDELRARMDYGSIFDDFAELDARLDAARVELADTLPESCRSCENTCRVRPWHGLAEGGDGAWNGMPSEKSCAIRRLVHEYLGAFSSRAQGGRV